MSKPRGRGRPALVEGEPSTQVNIRIPSGDYDRACRIAKRRDVSVSQVLRGGIKRAVECDEDDDD